MKIAPETAIKMAVSDKLKTFIAFDKDCIQPQERFLSGALGGAAAQVTAPYSLFKKPRTPSGLSLGSFDVLPLFQQMNSLGM